METIIDYSLVIQHLRMRNYIMLSVTKGDSDEGAANYLLADGN